jgi:hypothetical protein
VKQPRFRVRLEEVAAESRRKRWMVDAQKLKAATRLNDEQSVELECVVRAHCEDLHRSGGRTVTPDELVLIIQHARIDAEALLAARDRRPGGRWTPDLERVRGYLELLD